MGDMNSVFGGKLDRYIVGPQGLGKSVQMLTDFCERNATGLKSLGETIPMENREDRYRSHLDKSIYIYEATIQKQ
jgi:hypothetical protein